MKINLKSTFRIEGTSTDRTKVEKEEIEELEYDKYVEFYYTNLINSLILFSLNSKELEKLTEPSFDPIFELESEIDYAFVPVCFNTIFRKGLINYSFKDELLQFKEWTSQIPSEIWDWEFIEKHETWVTTRLKANAILDKLGVTSRIYNDDFITIYDNRGNIIKNGKNM